MKLPSRVWGNFVEFTQLPRPHHAVLPAAVALLHPIDRTVGPRLQVHEPEPALGDIERDTFQRRRVRPKLTATHSPEHNFQPAPIDHLIPAAHPRNIRIPRRAVQLLHSTAPLPPPVHPSNFGDRRFKFSSGVRVSGIAPNRSGSRHFSPWKSSFIER